MAFRIAPAEPVAYSKATRAVKAKPYLEWLHGLPCVVTGRMGVEAAHVSFANPALGAPGRGKGQKVSDRWAVPLHPDEHRRQHGMNEQEYWRSVGINPHMVGLVLWGLYSERKSDGTDAAKMLIASGLGRVEPLFEERKNA
ncbi:DUF968 domain-containing protein [Pseudohoeflea coraliihabitans]|uniref:DUF968 domain-containing protein n=1 Tax=Pseudohoeflea coraliihabitans TaxID=2860393 RepID=A0ABS6WLQ0_9HYPH|nr:DUF968 domain-containing protein [Pseudohoeflea sp. DP4N28-3]MBW3096856.1 DUF968 domain-containing protein [Pseudohoeflea sp. DP4N28-3]